MCKRRISLLATTPPFLSLRAPIYRGVAIFVVTSDRDCFVACGSSQRQEGVEIAEPVSGVSEESRSSQRQNEGVIGISCFEFV